MKLFIIQTETCFLFLKKESCGSKQKMESSSYIRKKLQLFSEESNLQLNVKETREVGLLKFTKVTL